MRILCVLSLTLFFLNNSTIAQVQSSERIVRPGVVHTFDIDRSGPWRMHILTIDLKRPDLTIRTARAFDAFLGREKTSSMAHRQNDSLYTVVAAINADFFNMKTGECENNQISNGVILKGKPPVERIGEKVRKNRTQFAVASRGRASIDRYSFAGTAMWKTGPATPIGGVNTITRDDPSAVFTPIFTTPVPVGDSASAMTVVSTRSVTLRGDTALHVVTQTGPWHDSIFVPGNGYLMVVHSSSANASVGDTVRFLFRFSPANNGLRELVGGFPQIVRDGKNVVAEVDSVEGPLMETFAFKRHPRTGIGYTISGDTLLWITSDGRQDSAAGMTLNEFADLMVSYHIYQGLNLDGGGSTTMVIDGNVVNSPSDKEGERPVSNCLLLLSRKSSR